MIVAVALVERVEHGVQRGPVVGAHELEVGVAERVEQRAGVVVVARPRGWSSESECRARNASRASSTSSSSMPARSAICAAVGVWPVSATSSSLIRSTRSASSCRSRGTRTDQPLSRKWRLIAPAMLGTA